MHSPSKLQLATFFGSSAILAGVAVVAFQATVKPPQTDIKTQTLAVSLREGSVTEGQNEGVAGTLKSAGKLTYESPETPTGQPKTNAISLTWNQTGGLGEVVEAEVRTFDSAWSEWVTLEGSGDQKDGVTPTARHSGVVLSKNVERFQYRFTINGAGVPTEVSQPQVVAIDSTQGPEPTKSSVLSKILGERVAAAITGPRIISRTEWGSPEGDSSPRWTPNYHPLERVVIHHTAATSTPDSGAAVRAVWSQHANTQGWGDIGYNYLVDKYGNVFQGRYYDKAYAAANNVEVEGGHAYGFNDRSSGISTLGNFQLEAPSAALMDSVANIAAFKMAPFGIKPWDVYADEGVVPGTPGTAERGPRSQYRLATHRDYLSTACPGNNLYANLARIRDQATRLYDIYDLQLKYDFVYQNQGVNGVAGGTVNLRGGQSASLYLDLKNDGSQTWSNTGATPVRIGTDQPLGHASSFASPDWLAPGRPTSFTQKVANGVVTNASSIAPGETARFTWTITAPPNGNGSVRAYYQPIAESFAWFPRNIGIHWLVNVTPEIYRYQYMTQANTVPTTPDTAGNVSVVIKNTGNVDWTNAGASAIRLGTFRPADRISSLQHPAWTSANRVTSFAGRAQLDANGNLVRDASNNVVFDSSATTIAPDQAAYFSVPVKTPNRVLVNNEYFNFVIDGKAWLNDVGLYWPVEVGQNYHTGYVTQAAPPTIIKSQNGVGSFSFDFKNTGSYAWSKNGVIKLAPANPLDRTSIFATFGLSGAQLPAGTTNWESGSRVGTFSGKVVNGTLDTSVTSIAPDETARFTFPLDARMVPAGTYREYFRLVAEGFAWLEEYGAYTDIVVRNN